MISSPPYLNVGAPWRAASAGQACFKKNALPDVQPLNAGKAQFASAHKKTPAVRGLSKSKAAAIPGNHGADDALAHSVLLSRGSDRPGPGACARAFREPGGSHPA